MAPFTAQMAETLTPTAPALLEAPSLARRQSHADCPVPAADQGVARHLVEAINQRVTPAKLSVIVSERHTPRTLRVSLYPVLNDMGAPGQIWKTVGALTFSSDETAGWALWQEALRVRWAPLILVNGMPIQGCQPIPPTGTFKARLELTTRSLTKGR